MYLQVSLEFTVGEGMARILDEVTCSQKTKCVNLWCSLRPWSAPGIICLAPPHPGFWERVQDFPGLPLFITPGQ